MGFIKFLRRADAGDLSARLAVVPMAQEGRGLDAGERLVQRLRSANDHRTADIVERICLEEMAHVAVGAPQYGRMCCIPLTHPLSQGCANCSRIPTGPRQRRSSSV